MLTKSNYLAGLQCYKLLHIIKNSKERLPESNIAQQFTFDEGTKVKELVTQLYLMLKPHNLPIYGQVL